MCGQLIGIYLATILDLFSDYRYKEKALRAACFRTWSVFSQRFPGNPCKPALRCLQDSGNMKSGKLGGQMYLLQVPAHRHRRGPALGHALAERKDRGSDGRQRPRRRRDENGRLRCCPQPQRVNGAPPMTRTNAALRARVSSMPWPRPLLQYCRPGPK